MHGLLQLLWTASAVILPYFAVADSPQKTPQKTDPPKKSESPAPVDRAVALFDKLDANHDGVITHSEVPADASPMLKALLWDADKKGEGKVSREAFVATLKDKASHFGHPPFAGGFPQHPFAGRFGEHPFAGPMHNGPKAAGRATAPAAGQCPLAAKPGAVHPGMPDLKTLFEKMDKNKDGKLSLEEFSDGMKELHRKIVAHFQSLRGSAPWAHGFAGGAPWQHGQFAHHHHKHHGHDGDKSCGRHGGQGGEFAHHHHKHHGHHGDKGCGHHGGQGGEFAHHHHKHHGHHGDKSCGHHGGQGGEFAHHHHKHHGHHGQQGCGHHGGQGGEFAHHHHKHHGHHGCPSGTCPAGLHEGTHGPMPGRDGGSHHFGSMTPHRGPAAGPTGKPSPEAGKALDEGKKAWLGRQNGDHPATGMGPPPFVREMIARHMEHARIWEAKVNDLESKLKALELKINALQAPAQTKPSSSQSAPTTGKAVTQSSSRTSASR